MQENIIHSLIYTEFTVKQNCSKQNKVLFHLEISKNPDTQISNKQTVTCNDKKEQFNQI